MKSLGFRNFRKFENLEPLELGGVTFLVGENNSGKSTFTKGALLLGNFLKMIKLNDVNEKHPLKKEFSFTSPKFRHVYIDTFHQALCNQAQNRLLARTSSPCLPGGVTAEYRSVILAISSSLERNETDVKSSMSTIQNMWSRT